MEQDCTIPGLKSYKSMEAQNLIKELGLEGYGIYCYICKKVSDERDFMLLTSYEILSTEMGVDADKIRRVVENYGLFSIIKNVPYLSHVSVIIKNSWRSV